MRFDPATRTPACRFPTGVGCVLIALVLFLQPCLHLLHVTVGHGHESAPRTHAHSLGDCGGHQVADCPDFSGDGDDHSSCTVCDQFVLLKHGAILQTPALVLQMERGSADDGRVPGSHPLRVDRRAAPVRGPPTRV